MMGMKEKGKIADFPLLFHTHHASREQFRDDSYGRKAVILVIKEARWYAWCEILRILCGSVERRRHVAIERLYLMRFLLRTSWHILCFFFLLSSIIACIPSGSSSSTSSYAPTTGAAQIAVNADKALATIPESAFGINTAVWDNNLLDPAVPDVLRKAGVTMLRYPGGSTADVYHWKDHTTTQRKDYVNPNTNFDAFMRVVQQVGAQAFITVNYGTNKEGTGGGDPAEAADWVRYANQTKKYGIKYWEIGNEVYGNGSYDARWEADLHVRKGPAAYANNVLTFAQMMKAADPTVKVGVSVTIPDLSGNQQTMANWNPTVLSLTCSQVDFVDMHWYPAWHSQDTGGPDEQLLSRPAEASTMLQRLRREIAQQCPAQAKKIEIFLGEVNTNIAPKQQVSLVNALFLADVYMDWLGSGGANVSWWDLHEGMQIGGNNRSAYGSTEYGTLGMLANGDCKSGLCQPPPDTPFPPYYGLQMLTHLGKPGDQIVAATSDRRLVTVHAVRQANGNLALLLINKDPRTTMRAKIVLSGYRPGMTATVYAYDKNSNAISSNSVQLAGAAFMQTLPPYSLTTLVLSPDE